MSQLNHSRAADPGLEQLKLPERRNAAVRPLLRQPSEDLAYVIGAWAATSEVGSPEQRHLSFCSLEERALSPLGDVLSRVSGEPSLPQATELHGAPAFRIRLRCPVLSEHLYAVTAANTRVAWEHIGSRQEFVAFVRGVFDNGGWISHGSSPGFGINKVAGARLLEEIGQACFTLGLYPLISDGHLPSLKFRERSDWRELKDTVGFSRSADQTQLEQLCLLRSKKRSFSVEEYRSVVKLSEHGNLSPAAISGRTGVPANTVRDWIVRGQVPRMALRCTQLESARKSLGDLSVIPLLYRQFGASSDCARACAKLFTQEQIQSVLYARTAEVAEAFGRDHEIKRILAS